MARLVLLSAGALPQRSGSQLASIPQGWPGESCRRDGGETRSSTSATIRRRASLGVPVPTVDILARAAAPPVLTRRRAAGPAGRGSAVTGRQMSALGRRSCGRNRLHVVQVDEEVRADLPRSVRRAAEVRLLRDVKERLQGRVLRQSSWVIPLLATPSMSSL